jgi:glycine/D-amino acid oxidase-like deaminating enzyme
MNSGAKRAIILGAGTTGLATGLGLTEHGIKSMCVANMVYHILKNFVMWNGHTGRLLPLRLSFNH